MMDDFNKDNVTIINKNQIDDHYQGFKFRLGDSVITKKSVSTARVSGNVIARWVSGDTEIYTVSSGLGEPADLTVNHLEKKNDGKDIKRHAPPTPIPFKRGDVVFDEVKQLQGMVQHVVQQLYYNSETKISFKLRKSDDFADYYALTSDLVFISTRVKYTV